MPGDTPVNIGVLLNSPYRAERRVLEIQTKLHHWAKEAPDRQFGDLFNLVADPAFLVLAWNRVRENKGARSVGVDGVSVALIERSVLGAEGFLEDVRALLKARTFQPVPVQEKTIPKANGKVRRLGIPTIRDRIVQASLKLVLEPILEADFPSSSYGFRPRRRAQDAIEEIRYYARSRYEWVFEGDIAACFDEIDHTALMERLRRRIGDRRVLALVKAFLKAGVLSEEGVNRESYTGTPQGGILSPLLANLALEVLDEHFAAKNRAFKWSNQRVRHRKRGGATYRLIRYADDFVVMVFGRRDQAEALWGEVGDILAPMGLRLHPEKTQVTHIDEGFDFLGFRIRRHQQRGSTRRLIYSYPSGKSLASVKRKVKMVTKQGTHRPAEEVFKRLNQITRGWTLYFKHGASSQAFKDLDHHLWWRLNRWLAKQHPRQSMRWITRHYFRQSRWWPEANGVRIRPAVDTHIERYRYRGSRIPTPWDHRPEPQPSP
ncbi:group II intron reverse transcriptase/maturase [Streptomyces inhibens]|uniref:Group II intron reverse transcriptase/maturase n=1 Tax=Streptomyces inhibens TaxID=2293571 RepID=A0A371Q1X3_STRIH|nr:group II intron reverse transcriptase/maturase [Streptomyces inhibens]REK88674.1 group II intron reverse transcriptase/maturase [Streptomyces inhibens]